jgi:hypothetical protein
MTPCRNLLAGASIAFLLLGLGSTVADAESWFTITQCDSVQIDGVYRPRITFSVTNHDPYWVISTIQACPPSTGASTDSCRALLATGPTDHWVGETQDCGGTFGAYWYVLNPFDPAGIFIAPGQTIGGFQLTVDRLDCCFTVYFANVELTPFAFDSLCFSCERPVAARSVSWGQLKSQYR